MLSAARSPAHPRERHPVKKIVFALVLGLLVSSVLPAADKGSLLIIGGGDRPDGLTEKFVALSRGFGAGKIVIFTMASGGPEESGLETAAEVKAAGAPDASWFHLTREEALRPESAAILEGAGGVYFCGGDQSRLTAVLLDTPIHQRLLELYGRGLVVAGTSAGAAAMSEMMITGNEKRTREEDENGRTIEAGNVETVRGFGFITGAVIDQHFVTRRRHNRLMSVVLENPGLLGVGIDESTAVWVRPDGKYEIAGLRQAVVYDARRASGSRTADGLLGAAGMTIHILLPGDVYDPAIGAVQGGRK